MTRLPAERRPSRLIIGIGNPSRGDDALGPHSIERLTARVGCVVELLTDFQLQVEHVLDLAVQRQGIIAAFTGPAPFRFEPVVAAEDAAFTSHSLSPAALLAAYADRSDPHRRPASSSPTAVMPSSWGCR